jgi:eukaryotic-like serine/threonine-protein kinase
MKHVREPLPNVQVRRPEVSSTLAAVVEHATAKETRNRYRTVDDMVHDLEQALAIEAARSGHTTGGEATSVLRHLPPDSSDYAPTRLRRPWRWLATAVLIGAIAAAALVVLAARTEQGTTGGADRAREGLSPATLLAANDYDPLGDDQEHPEEAKQAIDDNRTTFWSTEGYRGGLTKPGVGLYVDTGRPVAGRRLSIVSPDPGFEAAVYAADDVPAQIGGWTRVAAPREIGETARIRLDTRGREYRNYLVWITRLPPGQSRASISEITLLR